MSLLHDYGEITPDVTALECHACQHRHDPEWFTPYGELRCAECGTGGLIPRTSSAVSQRFPEPLGQHFVPVPVALLKHAKTLGLGSREVMVVIALESFRRLMGDEVFPGRRKLAQLTSLSEDQVKRASNKLVDKGLVTRRQPGKANAQGRASNRYCLDALWTRVAELETGQPLGGQNAPQTKAVNAGLEVHERPQTQTDEGLRAIPGGFAGDFDHVWGAQTHHEVDVVEVDAVFEVDPEGTSPAPPEPAATGLDSDLEHFEAWKRANAPNLSQAQARRLYTERQAACR